MPNLTTAAQVLDLKQALKTDHTRVTELRSITYRRQDLSSLKNILATDYQKSFIPHLDPAVLQHRYRVANTLAANQFELKVIPLSTDPSVVKGAQKLEDGLVALLLALFPQAVRERFYRVLDEPYAIVCLDLVERKALAKYADRKTLESHAEENRDDEDDEDYSPNGVYRRAYRDTDGTLSSRERHESAYGKVTDDALIEEIPFAIRFADALAFDAHPPSSDNPNRFTIAVEYGQKALNPLFDIFPDMKIRDGLLHFPDEKDKRRKKGSQSYDATVGPLVPDEGDQRLPGQQYVTFTQVRDCYFTYTVVEHPNGKKGPSNTDREHGVLIKTPNMYAGRSTGYYLVEANPRSEIPAHLEDCYDPWLYPLQVITQLVNLYQSAEGAMALDDALRARYERTDSPFAGAIDGADSTQATKSAQPTDGKPNPVTQGELKVEEGRGANLREYADRLLTRLSEVAPSPFPEGSGGSSESFAHLSAVLQVQMQEQVPIQIKIAECVKYIAQDILTCIAESGDKLTVPHVASGKTEMRTITPQMARLPVKLEVSLAASSPQADAANEVMLDRRRQNGIIGRTDFMEAIGYDDPEATYRKMIKDRINDGVADVVVDAAVSAVAEIAGEQFRSRFGAPNPPPQIVGPDGMPIQSQMPAAPTNAPVPPIQGGGVPTMGPTGTGVPM